MPSVDDRVVRMTFDNADFERKVQATIASLSELNKALKMEGAVKGLSGISDAASKVKFDPLTESLKRVKTNVSDVGKAVNDVKFDKMVSNIGAANKGILSMNDSLGQVDDNLEPVPTAIESVSSKFLVLGTVAATVLASITTKALAAGQNIVSSFSFDGMTAGFQEYETNIGAIQTILANTSKQGTNLVDVNNALDTLNEYSDKTIYNFGQMVSNIGKFTTAGVDLDTSVNSIKGLSNVAALSGASAEQAANGMYQLSQALSTGTVKLRDWISVEQAGMAGPLFQEALFETGKAMNTLKDVPMEQTFDEWRDSGNNFRESLADGWLTTEVLSTTLTALTGDLDRSQIAALGYSNAQSEQLYKLGQLALESATSVRTFSQLMGTLKETVASGWSESMRMIVGDFDQATKVFSTAYGYFAGVIGRMAKARNDLLAQWAFFGGRNSLFTIISSAIATIALTLGAVRKAFRDVFPKKTGAELARLTKSFGDFMYNLIPGPETLDKITRAARGFFSIFALGWHIIKIAVGFIWQLVQGLGSLAGGGFLTTLAKIGDVLFTIEQAVVNSDVIPKIFEAIATAAVALGGVLSDVGSEIFDFFKSLFPEDTGDKGKEAVSKITGFIDSIKELSVSTDMVEDVGDKIANFFTNLADSFNEFASGSADKVKDIFQGIVDAFRGFFSGIGDAIGSENTDKILKGMELGLLGGIVFVVGRFLKNMSFDKLFAGGLFSNISGAFGQMTSTLKTMQNSLKANILLKIAIAIGLLALAMAGLAMLDPAGLARASGAMIGLFVGLVGAFKILTVFVKDFSGRKLLALGGSLVLIAGSILILALALKVISGMDAGDIAGGLLVVALALGSLSGTVNSMSGANIAKVGINILLISAAILLLSFAVERFAAIPGEKLLKGGLAVAVALKLIAMAVNYMSGSNITGVGINILLISAAVIVFSYAVERFAAIPAEDLIKGGLAVAVALKLIALAVEHMGGSDIKGVGINVLLISASMLVLAFALEKMASIDPEGLGRGMIVFGLALFGIVVAANAMKGTEMAAVSILAIALALFVIANAMALLARIDTGKLLIALGVLISSILLIGAVAIAMNTVGGTASIGMLALALGGFAVALILAGIAAFLFARAFEILGKAGPEAMNNLRLAIIEFGSLIPDIAQNMVEGFIELLDGITENMPHIVDQLVAIGEELIRGFGDMVGPMEDVFTLILDTILRVINEYVPQIVATGVLLIMSLLEGIEKVVPEIAASISRIILNVLAILNFYLPQIVEAGKTLLVNFLNGIAQAIPEIARSVGDIIVAFIYAVGGELHRVITAGTDMLVKFLEGMRTTADRVMTEFRKTGTFIMQKIAANIIMGIDEAADILIGFINKMTHVINNRGNEFNVAVRNLGKAIGGFIIDGITLGIIDGIPDVKGTLRGLAEDVINVFGEKVEAKSPSLVFRRFGNYIAEGLVIGLNEGASNVERSSNQLGQSAVSNFQKLISKISDVGIGVGEINPVITPVLDLTEVQREAAKIYDYINTTGALTPSVSFGQASTIARTQLNQSTDSEQANAVGGSVNFEQNIYAPEQLSTSDIYKQTRNQIAMAKEELKIP